jgi:hypothetical protein
VTFAASADAGEKMRKNRSDAKREKRRKNNFSL